MLFIISILSRIDHRHPNSWLNSGCGYVTLVNISSSNINHDNDNCWYINE
jgi:hypothetical protein